VVHGTRLLNRQNLPAVEDPVRIGAAPERPGVGTAEWPGTVHEAPADSALCRSALDG
jgi:hypothetical protein